MALNPYAPPSEGQAQLRSGSGEVSPQTIEALRSTRPWAMVQAVIGLSTGVLSVLVGLLVLATAEGLEGAGPIGAGYIVFGVMVGGVGWSALRYGRAILQLLHGGGVAELELALDRQARFWRLIGLLALLAVLSFIGLVVVAAAGFSALSSF